MTERRPGYALLIAVGAAFALAGCAQEHDAPVNNEVAEVAPAGGEKALETTPGDVDATRVVDRAPVADAAPGFDVKAFAGAFAAEGASLLLAADGTYQYSVHAESADANLTSSGTWTVEADGDELLLDPDSKDDPDQRFTIASDDELIAVAGGRVLRRDGA